MSMTLISTVTLSGSSAITIFSSIPQTFTDLVLIASTRTAAAAVSSGFIVYPNSDATTVKDQRYLIGTGSTVSSTSSVNNAGLNIDYGTPGANATASTFGSVQLYFPNYTSSANKSVSYDGVMETNGSTAYQAIAAFLVRSTAAITDLNIQSTSNFAAGSTFSLYGITKGSGGATVS